MVEKLRLEVEGLNEKIRFIRADLEGALVINRRKKADVLADMRAMGFADELLYNTRRSNFTEEELQRLGALRDSKYQAYNYFSNIDSRILWLEDLDEFEYAYDQYYSQQKMPYEDLNVPKRTVAKRGAKKGRR